jgi:hypothetical protein
MPWVATQMGQVILTGVHWLSISTTPVGLPEHGLMHWILIGQMECLKEVLPSSGEKTMHVGFIEIADSALWQHTFSLDYHAVALCCAIYINYRKISEIC